MHATLVLVRKSILMFLHNRAAVVITFIVPIMIIYLVGQVYGLNRKDTYKGPTGIPLAVVDEAQTEMTQNLVNGLKNEKTFRIIDHIDEANGKTRPLTEADARAALKNQDYRYALIIPSDVVSLQHFGIRLKFLNDPRNDVETQMVTGILQKTIFMSAPRLLGQTISTGAEKYFGAERWKEFNQNVAHAAAQSFGGDEASIAKRLNAGDFFGSALTHPTAKADPVATDPTLRHLDQAAAASAPTTTATAATDTDSDSFLSRVFKFETEQVAGKQASNPTASRLVGGYAIFFLLFAVSGSASSLFEEKQLGIFQRLLSTSVSRSQILWSRFIFGTLLGVAQISAMFVFGNWMYHLDLSQHLGPLLAVSLGAAAACTSFGLAIAAVAPTQEAAAGLSTLLIMAMGSIGGAWFPVTFLPEFIQNFSRLSIVYWATEGFTDVLWAGKNLLQVLPTIGILIGIAAVVMALAVWLFRRNAMFD